jgi:hypothetical protein
MSNVQRKQAPRPARPAARYWKGKAPKGVTEVHSDSDLEDEGVPETVEERQDDEDIEEFGVKQEREPVKPRGMNIALKDVSVSKEGKVIVAGREESGRTEMEADEGDEGMPLMITIAITVLDDLFQNLKRKRNTKRKNRKLRSVIFQTYAYCCFN